MRALTYRTNARPALEERKSRRRTEAASRRVLGGNRVHISGRSVWRGFWYNKHIIAKWNRPEQVLVGMRWNYYMGRRLNIASISLLDNHSRPAAPQGRREHESLQNAGAGAQIGAQAESRHGTESPASGNTPGHHASARRLPDNVASPQHAHIDGAISEGAGRALPAHNEAAASAPPVPQGNGHGKGLHPGQAGGAAQQVLQRAPAGNCRPKASTPCKAIAEPHVVRMGISAPANNKSARPHDYRMPLKPEIETAPGPPPAHLARILSRLMDAAASGARIIIRHAAPPGNGGNGEKKPGFCPTESKALMRAVPQNARVRETGPADGMQAAMPAGRNANMAETGSREQAGTAPAASAERTGPGYIGSRQRKVVQLKVARADALPPQ
jgi:hypothetical protein